MRRLLAAAVLTLGCSRSPAPAATTAAPPPSAPAAGVEATGVRQVPGFVRELRRIDVTLGGDAVALDALVTRPADGALAPLVVLNHGSPRDASERLEMSPTNQSGQAMVFARRGYAVVAVMRRGFGKTGGAFAEAPGPCENRQYVRASRSAAEDILAAIGALKNEPWVDASRIVLVGHSAGGMAVLATAAARMQPVAAVISFAGGRGSDAPDHVCQPERLVDSCRGMGVGVTAPSLWIYAENDHFFAPPLVREMFDAYRAGGAPAELVLAPPFGADGHALFSSGSSDLWWPAVASFLAKQHLPTELVRPRPPVDLPPPPTGPQGKEVFATYVASESIEKAFAIGPGGFGFALGRRDTRDAQQRALSNCAKHTTGPCALYAVGDALAPSP